MQQFRDENGNVYRLNLENRVEAADHLQGMIQSNQDQIQEARRDLDHLLRMQRALEAIEDIMVQMRTLAVEASAESCGDRRMLQESFDEYKRRIQNILYNLDSQGIRLPTETEKTIRQVVGMNHLPL